MPVVRDEPVSVSNNTTSPHSKKGKFHQEMHDNEVKPAPLASDDRSSLESNVLIVVENGVAPVKGGITIPIPIPTAGLVPIAFPTLETDPLSTIKAENIILPDNTNTKLELIASVEAMAKRSLKDRLPYIMVRAAVRAAIKGATQALAYNQSTLAGAAINLFNAATERPDERIWKTLPSNISIARVRLPEGNQVLKLQTSDGERVINVRVKGKYCVIPIRIIGKSSYVLQES
jgi:hypothetical protein